MGEVVNLRKWRRARDRTAEAAQAEANRTAFGRTKAEKQRDAEEAGRRKAVLDAARLSDSQD